jgi:chromosome partitioning protein
MTKVISISIFKGGTGKTTTAVSLASALTQLGQRVLLVDLDQQASATRHLGLDPGVETPNLYHVFRKQVPAGAAVKETGFGFHIIPGIPFWQLLKRPWSLGMRACLGSSWLE